MEVDEQAFGQAIGGQALAQGNREMFWQQLVVAAHGFQWCTEIHAGAEHEAIDIVLSTEHGGGLAPFGQHVVRLEAALGEDGVALLGLLFGALPDEVDLFRGLAEEVQLRLRVDGVGIAHHTRCQRL